MSARKKRHILKKGLILLWVAACAAFCLRYYDAPAATRGLNALNLGSAYRDASRRLGQRIRQLGDARQFSRRIEALRARDDEAARAKSASPGDGLPTATPEAAARATDTPKPTATATNTLAVIARPTDTPKPTATATNTLAVVARPTPTPRPTATATNTLAVIARPTPTPRPTAPPTSAPTVAASYVDRDGETIYPLYFIEETVQPLRKR